MEPKDLVGEHVLSGVQLGTMPKWDKWQDSDPNTVDFILDGRIISAIEDPEDGYRSCMHELLVDREGVSISNVFASCKVLGTMRMDTNWEKNDIIDFVDVITGKVVLSIGTENFDDYYPCFVGEWHPENLCLNI